MLYWKRPRDQDQQAQLLAQESHHVPESIVQKLLELRWAWCCDHFPGGPVPVSSHPLGKKLLPGIQPKPPLTQLHEISLNPVSGHKSEEISACPSSSPREGVEQHNEVSLLSPPSVSSSPG